VKKDENTEGRGISPRTKNLQCKRKAKKFLKNEAGRKKDARQRCEERRDEEEIFQTQKKRESVLCVCGEKKR